MDWTPTLGTPMPPLRAYLMLRARLLIRWLREIGWLRLAVLAPVAVAASGRLVVMAAPHELGQWALSVGTAFALASAHRQRGDLAFLRISAPGHQRWLAVEYALLAAPAAAALVAMGNWAAAVTAVGLGGGTAWLPPRREWRSTRQHPRSVFRSEAFEWVSGMRRGMWLLWLVLLVGALWQHASPLGPIVALAVWLLAVLACYGVPEPATMVAVAARGPGPFLRRRLALGLGYAGLTAAPLLWLLGAGPAGGGAVVAVGVAWLGLVALIILAKYAFYPNATHFRVVQALVVGGAVVGAGHPTYPVLLLVAAGGLTWQSVRRLRRTLGS